MTPSTTQADKQQSFQQFISQIEDYESRYREDITPERFFGYPIDPVLEIESRLRQDDASNVAYFSMEFGIAPSIYNSFSLTRPMSRNNQFFVHEVFSNYWLCDYLFKIQIDKMLDIPIYGGGLGVLAGDSMKSSADHGFGVAGIGLLWNKGYFKQKFWYKHGQVPAQLRWDPMSYPGLIPLKDRIVIETNEGPLHLRIWKYYVYSYDQKRACPILLLDSNIEDNPPNFRQLTDSLYRSDDVWWKIFQRAILGLGGIKALRSQQYNLDCYHLNEGHAAFALIERYVTLDDASKGQAFDQFVYTCHTPVAAGHDRFTIKDIERILPAQYAQAAKQFGTDPENSDLINLTTMCLTNCRQRNAVAKKHGEIMRLQFPQYADEIQSITNGIHHHTWISESFTHLLDKYSEVIGDWRKDPEILVNVMKLKDDEQFRKDIYNAHLINKRNFINIVEKWQLKEDVLTIGWARRIAAYKRPALIFHNIESILKIAYNIGPVQIILAGKAHPNDDIGGAHIDEILDHIDQLNQHWKVVKVLILENYDTYFGKLLTNSVDVWLNNPLPPFEASGTSGMKAILNGVPQLSTLDGWVVEAEQDDIGWIFGYRHQGPEVGSEKQLRLDEDSKELYDTLIDVGRMYYDMTRDGAVNYKSPWIDKMIHCLYRSAFFNTHRMMKNYHEMMWQKVGVK